MDYLFIRRYNGCWALLRDYRWGSPSSLYTFRKTRILTKKIGYVPSRLGSGLPALLLKGVGFPEFTQFITPALPQGRPIPESLASASFATRALCKKR